MVLVYSMEEISISKLSPKVLSRLEKNLPIRIKKGDDSKLVVDTKEAKRILKNFIKGKGVTKAFSDKEIEENATIGGKGIFGKRFDKFLKRLGKKTGINVKKAVYAVGDVIKPFAKQAIKSGLDAVANVADPFLGNVGIASTITDGISKKADQFLDKPSDFGIGGRQKKESDLEYIDRTIPDSILKNRSPTHDSQSDLDYINNFGMGSGLYAGGSGLYAGAGLYATGRGFYSPEGTYHPNNVLTHRHNFNKHRDIENSMAGNGLYAQTHIKGGSFFGDIRKSVSQGKKAISAITKVRPALSKVTHISNNFGGGQLQRNVPRNEIASIGLGGNVLSEFEQPVHMRSQPYSTHFAWGNTLPKYYQQFNNGLQ